MGMTSCNMSLFVPLISAPLLKVESNIQLDMVQIAPTTGDNLVYQQDYGFDDHVILTDLSPPGFFPLLI